MTKITYRRGSDGKTYRTTVYREDKGDGFDLFQGCAVAMAGLGTAVILGLLIIFLQAVG